jgi:hypothetical protein
MIAVIVSVRAVATPPFTGLWVNFGPTAPTETSTKRIRLLLPCANLNHAVYCTGKPVPWSLWALRARYVKLEVYAKGQQVYTGAA